MLKFISRFKKEKIIQSKAAQTRKASLVNSKLHSGKFKFSNLRSFLSSNRETGNTFKYFSCSLNKILTNVGEFLIDTTALKLAIKLDGFNPKEQTKRARIKTCIIHCSIDESFLIRAICLKISMLWKSSLEMATINWKIQAITLFCRERQVRKNCPSQLLQEMP